MRIRLRWTGTVSPCGATSYGEVEDYKITVIGESAGMITGYKAIDEIYTTIFLNMVYLCL